MGTNYEVMMNRARLAICKYVETRLDKTLDPYEDVYLVWYCKNLKNQKMLFKTSLVDGRYYEVTHNGETKELYLDVYKKERNLSLDFADQSALENAA